MICFHPRHDLTLARMDVGDIVSVVQGWKGIYAEEGEWIRAGSGDGYVQIFEVSSHSYERQSTLGADSVEPRVDDGCFGSSSPWASLDPVIVGI